MRTWRFYLGAAIAALLIAGCGSSSSKGPKGLTVLDCCGGVDSLDPGFWYFETDYAELYQPTQRALFGWRPSDASAPSPDIATGLPAVSDGGKTLTIHLRTGIHYSPPLQQRTVTAADIKYAIERCFLASVGNGYALTYYANIVGAPSSPLSKYKPIAGIQAPNATTLTIKLTAPVGVLGDATALALPCTVPVPKEYAQRYDRGAQSSYGQHQVFTGPYMIKGAGSGAVPGSSYQSGKLLVLVANPSWQQSSDPIRARHFTSITVRGGNDVTVASRQILNGSSMISGDWAAPPTQVLKQGVTTLRSQFSIRPSHGVRYLALNTQVKPLDNVNFRRAIVAVLNREALRLTRGGVAIGTLATHFIPPGVGGFDQAGGFSGAGYDFYANPTGSVTIAESYMRKAGYPTGRYTGPPLLAIADNQAPASNTAEAIQSQLSAIGVRLTLREVAHQTLLSKFCGVPKAAVAICPTLSWDPDFPDGQSMIDPVFNGKNIVPTGNTNVSQANDPALNKQMDAAEALTNPVARAQAWGKLDREVTAQAYAAVWLWDNDVVLASKNVRIVTSPFNSNDADYTASSLK
jgi:peptide/nickel transport system substrate-binding protein